MVFGRIFSSWCGLKMNQEADIHSAHFKIYYRLTPKLLFALCLLVVALNIFDNPTKCSGDTRIRQEVVDDYCWSQNVFTVSSEHVLKSPRFPDREIAHPGIRHPEYDVRETVKVSFQWVPVVLFIQGLIFYVPHLIWKAFEGGRVRSLAMGLSVPLMAKEEGQEKIHALANYLHASLNRHKFYAIVLIVCENLNYVICLANLGFLNKFLDGAFFEYGFSMLSLIQHPPAERVDPLLLTFPRVAKCTFYNPGPSGSIERYDLMCTLAHNGTSEKIFVFLCFYFIILTALGSAVFLFYLIICFSPSIRLSLLRKKGNLHSDIDRIKNQLGIGEFVLLYLLSKNVEFHAFSMLMEELSNKILGIKRTNVYPNSSTIESIPLERITENV